MKVKIKKVKIVPGSTLSKYWESDMQVITTDKGKYIDNAVDSDYEMGYDWEEKIGSYVNVKINNSKGHKWINYKGKAKETTYTDKEWNDTSNANDSDITNNDGIGWRSYMWAIIILLGIVIAYSK